MLGSRRGAWFRLAGRTERTLVAGQRRAKGPGQHATGRKRKRGLRPFTLR